MLTLLTLGDALYGAGELYRFRDHAFDEFADRPDVVYHPPDLSHRGLAFIALVGIAAPNYGFAKFAKSSLDAPKPRLFVGDKLRCRHTAHR